MASATSNVEGVLADLLTPILPNIGGEPTREGLIGLLQFISGNAASVASNLGGGLHRNHALRMMVKEYKEQTGFAFLPPHITGDHPHSMESAQ